MEETDIPDVADACTQSIIAVLAHTHVQKHETHHAACATVVDSTAVSSSETIRSTRSVVVVVDVGDVIVTSLSS